MITAGPCVRHDLGVAVPGDEGVDQDSGEPCTHASCRVEVVPVGPLTNQVGVGNEYPWGIRMALHDTDWFSRLNQECLIVFERF